jgi:hypothetical protein
MPTSLGMSQEDIIDEILMTAWANMSTPGVAEALAMTIANLARKHHLSIDKFLASYKKDSAKRRTLLKHLLVIIGDSGEDKIWVFYSPWRLLVTDDLPWLLEQLDLAGKEAMGHILSRLISSIFDRSDQSQCKAVAVAAKRHAILRSILMSARQVRRQMRRYQDAEQRRRTDRELKMTRQRQEIGSPSKKVTELLDDCERGDFEAWWKIDYWLRISEDLEHEWSEVNGSLSECPGWLVSSSETKMRLLSCAERYLLSANSYAETYIDAEPNSLYRIPLVAYRAFRLLSQERSATLQSLEFSVWRRWAPAILHFIERSSNDTPEGRNTLLVTLYRNVPDEVCDWLVRALDRKTSSEEPSHFLDIYRLESILDERLMSLLWSRFSGSDPLSQKVEGATAP